MLIHFIQPEQFPALESQFAQPQEINGELQWVLPEWLLQLKAHVQLEQTS